MKKLFLLLLSVLISTQTFAASSALNFGALGVSGSGTITSWAAYTPTLTNFGSPTNVSFFWRQVRDTLEVKGSITAGSGSGVGSISFPSAASAGIDTAKMSIASSTSSPGEVVGWSNEGFNAYLHIPLLANTSTSTTVVYVGRSINVVNWTTPNTSIQYDSGQVVDFKFSVPIVGW